MADHPPNDLLAEVARAGAAMTGARLGWLAAMGCARGFIRSGGVGEGRVRFLEDRRYELGDDGVEALVLGAWDGRPNISLLVDLIALEIGGGARWGARLGIAVALSGPSVSPLSDTRLRVFQQPWHWLQGSAEGMWILDPSTADARDLLLPFSDVVADDLEHGRLIDEVLRRPLPRVWVAP